MSFTNREIRDAIWLFMGGWAPAKINLDSLRFSTHSSVWVARLSEEADGKQYYRIAEGIGKKVHSVTPRMLANSTPGAKWRSKSRDNRPNPTLAFDQLDWLFEARDA